jgi:NAD(P)H dehydrogenase (quinone)
MKILVILAHPNRKSFNHSIANQVLVTLGNAGHDIIFHDLYDEKFNPLLPYREIREKGTVAPVIEEHCRQLTDSDGIVFIHPNWWGQPPAILKGWIDRVMRPGTAYEFQEGDGGEGIPFGLLTGKRALVFNTSNTPDERERDIFGDPLESIWKKCIFHFCGIERSYRKVFNIVVTSSPEQIRRWLKEVEGIVEEFFSER